MRIYPGRIMNNFIEQNKRQYAIPVYQRNYEWSKDQCVKLFQDIIVAAHRGKEHFCGSVVYSLMRFENNINHYIIIDGQQRMTTVYLLLKALMDMAETDSERDTIEGVLINSDPFNTYAVDVASKLKLKPIKSDNNQLLLLMDGKMDEIDKSSGIWHNYELFCDLIREQQATGMTVTQIYYGIQQLTCVDIGLDPDDNAQEIFERINSTGVPLSLADKIRNFVLMVDADQETLYEQYWLPAENAVCRENMTAFFLDYLNMKIDGFTRVESAYDEFKHLYESGDYTNESMLKEIKHYADFYKAFLFGDSSYSDEVNALLTDLQRLKQTTVFLFLFHVFDDFNYGNGVIDETELIKVLTFLRNYSIRRLMCEVSSNSLRGLYKTLYARLFSKKGNKDHYYDSLVSFFTQLTSRDVLPSEDAFAAALAGNNLYRKNALCKYLLSSIENQGKERIDTEPLTIEHIMPQNKGLSPEWQKMLGDNWESVHAQYLHTLGNLTLTGYNSELGDLPFGKKKEKLQEVHTKVTRLNEAVLSQEDWNEAAIAARAESLVRTIAALFPIEQPLVAISFADPQYQEYTIDDPSTATYKTPNYYILGGERVLCSNFSDMLRSVIERLYARDDGIIKNMARSNERLIDWSQNVMFSFDPTVVTSGYKIKGTDIYENIGYSASHIISIIRALLDRYDIDQSEFVYSAKSSKTADGQD